MDYEVQKKGNIGGLIGLFILFTLAGIIISFVYIFARDQIPYVYFRILMPIAFGAILAYIVSFCKKTFKITSTVGTLVVVVLGIIVITYVKWNIFFTMLFAYGYDLKLTQDFAVICETVFDFVKSPGRFMSIVTSVNESGSWSYDGTDISGIPLTIIWIIEFIIIAYQPIKSAIESSGVFIVEKNMWATPHYLGYNFTMFDKYEIEKIGGGEIDTIINKPLDPKVDPKKCMRIAIYYTAGDPTEYIGIYKKSAKMVKPYGKAIRITAEKARELEDKLYAKYNPAPQQSPIEIPKADTSVSDNNIDQSM